MKSVPNIQTVNSGLNWVQFVIANTSMPAPKE